MRLYIITRKRQALVYDILPSNQVLPDLVTPAAVVLFNVLECRLTYKGQAETNAAGGGGGGGG